MLSNCFIFGIFHRFPLRNDNRFCFVTVKTFVHTFKNKWLFSYRSSCRFLPLSFELQVFLVCQIISSLQAPSAHTDTQQWLICVGEAVLVKLNDKQAASQHLRSSQLGCLFYDNWYRINVIHSILTLIFRFYFQCQYAKKEQCEIKHLVMNMIHNLIFINIKPINLKDSLLPQW